MAKVRGGGVQRNRAAVAPRRERGALAVVGILAIVLIGTSLAVDTAASAAFDAPKRAIALLGTALAAAVALLSTRRSESALARWRSLSVLRRAALLLAAAALLGAFVSALASPRRALALDALRAIALLALLLPLGASAAVRRGRHVLAACFLAACAINASVSILQGLDLFHPFALETTGSRQETGAYAGNVGYLSIVLALAVVLSLGVAVSDSRRPIRALAGAAFLLFAADLLVNRNLTALSSAMAGVATLLLVRFRRRAALPLVATLLAAGLLVAAYPPLRDRVKSTWFLTRAGDWNALLSFRGGPWAAGLEIVRARPLLGSGPGTFASEYVPYRLAAELRAHRRFVSPLVTSSYGETHNDFLQAASDGGLPVALFAAGAAGCLLAAVARAAWMRRDSEAALLLSVLVAGAVAALTWFPMQRPVTAVPLLLVAGRAWRVSAEADREKTAA